MELLKFQNHPEVHQLPPPTIVVVNQRKAAEKMTIVAKRKEKKIIPTTTATILVGAIGNESLKMMSKTTRKGEDEKIHFRENFSDRIILYVV